MGNNTQKQDPFIKKIDLKKQILDSKFYERSESEEQRIQMILKEIKQCQKNKKNLGQKQESEIIQFNDGFKDERRILDKINTFKSIGQILAKWDSKELNYGSCTLIKIEIPEAILKEYGQRHRSNKRNQIYLILTSAYNLAKYRSKSKITQKAQYVLVNFGKQQNLSIQDEYEQRIQSSLMLEIRHENFFVHSKFKQQKSDFTSGHDIALISIDLIDYDRLEDYIKHNKEDLYLQEKKEEQKLQEQKEVIINNLNPYFFENNIYQQYEKASIKKNESIKYKIGVCGYPAEEEYLNKGFPQVQMIKPIKQLKISDDHKTIQFQNIQSSKGQSGSPILMEFGNSFQVVGVHSGHQKDNQNIGTFIRQLTFESFEQIFSQGDDSEKYRFEKFIKDQIQIQDQYYTELYDQQQEKEFQKELQQAFEINPKEIFRKISPNISVSDKFDEIGPLIINNVNGMYQQFKVEFNPKTKNFVTIKKEVKIGLSNYIYTGMACNKNLPNGFGRAIDIKNGKLIDGMFLNGERHGYSRIIFQNGKYSQAEYQNGKWIRDLDL